MQPGSTGYHRFDAAGLPEGLSEIRVDKAGSRVRSIRLIVGANWHAEAAAPSSPDSPQP